MRPRTVKWLARPCVALAQANGDSVQLNAEVSHTAHTTQLHRSQHPPHTHTINGAKNDRIFFFFFNS